MDYEGKFGPVMRRGKEDPYRFILGLRVEGGRGRE